MNLLFDWSNFWINKRKVKSRIKLIEALCNYLGMSMLSFHSLPKRDQDYLIDQYKKTMGIP